MKNIIIGLLLLSIFTQATEIIQEGKPYPLDKLKAQNQQIIKMVVEEIGKTLPQTVDQYTQLIKIRDENLTLIYTFEINTGAKSDEAVKKEDRSRMQHAVTKGVCQSSKRFLEAGILLSYEYLSTTSHQELFRFDISPQVCKGVDHD